MAGTTNRCASIQAVDVTVEKLFLHSNIRWFSDGFVINCHNGDKVFIAFALDTCDREILRYVASTKGIDGEMIRDLMGRIYPLSIW